MPVADWSVPFVLTSSRYSATALDINTPVTFPAGQGVFLLDPSQCRLRSTVRATKENVPQQDGSIMHRRFTTGLEMDLVFQLWQNLPNRTPACDDLQQQMMDALQGYMYGLLNAGDNEGRIAWLPHGNSSAASAYRMLDDIRLWSWGAPGDLEGGIPPLILGYTIDCALPYAEDLTAQLVAIPGTVTNLGNRPLFPVIRLDGGFTTALVENTTTGQQWSFDAALPGGGGAIGGGDFLEINIFNNTVYLNGDGANRSGGVVQQDTQFFEIAPGDNTITVTGTTGTMEINSAWA